MRCYLLVMLLIPQACWGAEGDKLASQVREVLRSHCFECHNGPGSTGGDVDFRSREAIVEAGFVEPSNPDSSYLVQRVLDESMPPPDQRERNPVTPAEREILKAWVMGGAPDFAAEAEVKEHLALPTILTAVRDYLRGREAADRPFLRFFTIHQTYNSPGVTAADLALHRAALSKALNSLSWSPDLILPEPIDAKDDSLHGTVLVIDTRELIDADGKTWAERGHWNRLVRAYPYGLAYNDYTDDNRRQLMDEIVDLLDDDRQGVRLPLLRVDWFVATATRPPLYHDLLGLPETAKELEERLGVNIRAAFEQPTIERIARAGFARSGVSAQNRLLERHRSRYGWYWKSYDFKPSAKTASLVRFPLGPADLFGDAPHPFADQAFVHDGGEIIFTLPNGLQAYLLVDGKDQRINEGPIDVVSDSLKTSGTPAIVNGLSCMACHKHGMIDFVDEIRAGSGVFGEAADQVQQLYPRQNAMNQLVGRDRDRFVEALERATGRYWTDGNDPSDKPITERPEPIGEVARLYRLVHLNAATIAAELDFASPEEIERRASVNNIKSLGLESVLRHQGNISRNVWESSDGLSLMQDLAFEVGFTPFR